MTDAKIIMAVTGTTAVVACAVCALFLASRQQPSDSPTPATNSAVFDPVAAIPVPKPTTHPATIPATQPKGIARGRVLRTTVPEPTYKTIPLSRYIQLMEDKDHDTRVEALRALGMFDAEKSAADALDAFIDERRSRTDDEIFVAVISLVNVTGDPARCLEVSRQRFRALSNYHARDDSSARFKTKAMMRWLATFSRHAHTDSDKGEVFSMLRKVVRDPHAPSVVKELTRILDQHPQVARLIAPEIVASRPRVEKDLDWQTLVEMVAPLLGEPDTIGVPPQRGLIVPKFPASRQRNDQKRAIER